MPEILEHYLANLKRKEVDQVWCWLDENPATAISDMLNILAATHPEMRKEWLDKLRDEANEHCFN